jgi:acetoin utilization deacetylase AcuC-like enzyme
MKVIFSPQCLDFNSPGHPESPERVKKAHRLLTEEGFAFAEPQPCTEEDLLLVHAPSLIESVKTNDFFDWDTPNHPHIYDYATLAVGGALLAMTYSLSEGRSFSLMRPPGHHASRTTLGGFCYFNNIAVSVAQALQNVDRVAILDFDCHHGNGTQDIFLGDERVLYVSWHQTHIFPGTGYQHQVNCLNYPVTPEDDHESFMELFFEGLENVKKFDPQLIAVSAGFDSYIGDPLSMLRLEKKTYEEIGKNIKTFNLPSFAVLEGGYGPEFSQCVLRFLQGYF